MPPLSSQLPLYGADRHYLIEASKNALKNESDPFKKKALLLFNQRLQEPQISTADTAIAGYLLGQHLLKSSQTDPEALKLYQRITKQTPGSFLPALWGTPLDWDSLEEQVHTLFEDPYDLDRLNWTLNKRDAYLLTRIVRDIVQSPLRAKNYLLQALGYRSYKEGDTLTANEDFMERQRYALEYLKRENPLGYDWNHSDFSGLNNWLDSLYPALLYYDYLLEAESYAQIAYKRLRQGRIIPAFHAAYRGINKIIESQPLPALQLELATELTFLKNTLASQTSSSLNPIPLVDLTEWTHLIHHYEETLSAIPPSEGDFHLPILANKFLFVMLHIADEYENSGKLISSALLHLNLMHWMEGWQMGDQEDIQRHRQKAQDLILASGQWRYLPLTTEAFRKSMATLSPTSMVTAAHARLVSEIMDFSLTDYAMDEQRPHPLGQLIEMLTSKEGIILGTQTPQTKIVITQEGWALMGQLQGSTLHLYVGELINGQLSPLTNEAKEQSVMHSLLAGLNHYQENTTLKTISNILIHGAQENTSLIYSSATHDYQIIEVTPHTISQALSLADYNHKPTRNQIESLLASMFPIHLETPVVRTQRMGKPFEATSWDEVIEQLYHEEYFLPVKLRELTKDPRVKALLHKGPDLLIHLMQTYDVIRELIPTWISLDDFFNGRLEDGTQVKVDIERNQLSIHVASESADLYEDLAHKIKHNAQTNPTAQKLWMLGINLIELLNPLGSKQLRLTGMNQNQRHWGPINPLIKGKSITLNPVCDKSTLLARIYQLVRVIPPKAISITLGKNPLRPTHTHAGLAEESPLPVIPLSTWDTWVDHISRQELAFSPRKSSVSSDLNPPIIDESMSRELREENSPNSMRSSRHHSSIAKRLRHQSFRSTRSALKVLMAK